jgi:hypothetical protein
LLLDQEVSDRRLLARLRYARLRHQAAVEDVDYRAARGLDRALFQKLAEGSWIDAHENLILCGPTGVGKSWLSSALGHKACRDNRSVLYQRIPKLFADLALARGDGRYARILRALGGVQLLILDDWGLQPLDAAARHDLLEILEERYGRRSTIITSQIPVDKWHELTRQQSIQGLTGPPPNAKNYSPARRQTPGDIMSESWATLSRNPRAASSEFAQWAAWVPSAGATSSSFTCRAPTRVLRRRRENL